MRANKINKTRPSRVRRTDSACAFRARERKRRAPPRTAPFSSIHAKKDRETKPKLSEHPIPRQPERRYGQEVRKVEAREELADRHKRVLDWPRAPEGQHTEGQDEKPEQTLRGGVVGVALYPVSVDKREDEQDQ